MLPHSAAANCQFCFESEFICKSPGQFWALEHASEIKAFLSFSLSLSFFSLQKIQNVCEIISEWNMELVFATLLVLDICLGISS